MKNHNTLESFLSAITDSDEQFTNCFCFNTRYKAHARDRAAKACPAVMQFSVHGSDQHTIEWMVADVAELDDIVHRMEQAGAIFNDTEVPITMADHLAADHGGGGGSSGSGFGGGSVG